MSTPKTEVSCLMYSVTFDVVGTGRLIANSSRSTPVITGTSEV